MKNTYTYYVCFPYIKWVSELTKIGEYDRKDDLIQALEFSPEDIESLWGIEFFYPDGKTHKWYEDNKWWENEEIYDQFIAVDGKVDYDKQPLFNGIPLKTDKVYTFECVEDDEVPHRAFVDRIIKSRIKGLGGWKIHDVD